MAAFGRKRPLKTAVFQQSERPLSGKGDIPLLFCSGVTSTLMTLFTGTVFAPRHPSGWGPISARTGQFLTRQTIYGPVMLTSCSPKSTFQHYWLMRNWLIRFGMLGMRGKLWKSKSGDRCSHLIVRLRISEWPSVLT